MSDLIKIGSLWINDSKEGKILTGRLGDAKLLLLKNKYKKTDKHPDYNIYVAKNEKREEKKETQEEKKDTLPPF